MTLTLAVKGKVPEISTTTLQKIWRIVILGKFLPRLWMHTKTIRIVARTGKKRTQMVLNFSALNMKREPNRFEELQE